jgi:hypothetical protein
MPTPDDFGDFQFGTGDSTNSQFSSDKASTPEAMAAETAASQNAFADLQQFLMTSPYLVGSRICHAVDEGPWEPPHPENSGPGTGRTGPA